MKQRDRFDAFVKVEETEVLIRRMNSIRIQSKAQQDSFLPVMEDGTIILIGATTENPSFEVIPALRSRARVYVLNELSKRNEGSFRYARITPSWYAS